ncbi:hypothetical protein J2S00_004032 [Caldalkalibacillus uzonensis]|uniref:Uncharacterized protein n=1 Tax=Caldalkalibacillus uzonensis TaxID=353224 RepID=A0ABU0CYG8_9BACI|nr:hypothetical protein [Caldalkalibacillus uzonensis]MDQ0341188.1 hypothetical protein [Caldalkalibacillus uzonensis]
MDSGQNNKRKSTPPPHDPIKEALNGLIGGVILMIIGILFAHFVLGMPIFP